MGPTETQTFVRVPTSGSIRETLLQRANEYAAKTKLSLSTVSDHCAGDGKFLLDVESGKNFTVDRYQKAMDWLDAHWPTEARA